MNNKKRFLPVILLCLLLSSIFIGGVWAADSGEGSITVHYLYGDTAISGAEFRLYRAGELAADGTIYLTGDFADYNVTIPDSDDSSDWDNLANTLADYAARDGITPQQTGVTDDNGELRLPAEGTLQAGVYLLVGDYRKLNGNVYSVSPALIAVPGRNSGGETIADVSVYPKSEANGGGSGKDGGEPSPITERTVVKTWNDAGNEAYRPDSITVQLLDNTGSNSIVVDTVELNANNHWSYTWDFLEAGRSWRVVEKAVADGYTVSTERHDNIVYIVNTFDESKKPPVKPGDKENPEKPNDQETPSNDPNNPDNPNGPNSPNSPNSPNGPNGGPGTDPGSGPDKNGIPTKKPLPQTGVLWWPVPMMALSGMILMLVGFIFRRRESLQR